MWRYVERLVPEVPQLIPSVLPSGADYVPVRLRTRAILVPDFDRGFVFCFWLHSHNFFVSPINEAMALFVFLMLSAALGFLRSKSASKRSNSGFFKIAPSSLAPSPDPSMVSFSAP